jgi:hypothetical protein
VELIFQAAIFALGLCWGSFLNVCIYRLPLGKSVVAPRSACPHCGKMIPLYHNVPVLSWLILGGKCRNCKEPISPRYLVVELLTGVLFLSCYLHFGPTLATVKCAVLGFLLLGLIFADAETKLLPDAMTLPGLAIGIGFTHYARHCVADDAGRDFVAAMVAFGFALGRGRGRVVSVWRGCNLSAGARGRGHGIRRRQADGDDRRVPRNEADSVDDFRGLARRFDFWFERCVGGLAEALAADV